MTLANLLHRRTPIGLDIGCCCVKAVQSIRGRRGYKLAACTRFPRAKPEAPISVEELSEIRAVLGRQGFAGTDVVVAATPEKLLSGVLELPARAPGVPIEQIARMEFARIHKCDIAAAEFGWWGLPAPVRAGKATHVMAVAYPHEHARQQLAMFDQAGFKVRAMDTQASALTRTCLAAAGGVRTLAALDLGWSFALLVLVRNGVVAYERRIASGGLSKLHAALETRLQLEPGAIEQLVQDVGLGGDAAAAEASEARALIVAHLDAVVAEVRKACGYAQHQYPDAPVELLVLAGGGGCMPGATEHFRSSLGFEARRAGGTIHLESEGANARQLPTASHASAAGLAAFLH